MINIKLYLNKKTFYWVLKLAAAIIMLQTLYFKFSAHPESVALFTNIGMEPWGRIGVGIAELVASILILSNRFEWLGAIMGVGLMVGAIFFHLTFLGIDQLFVMAVIVLIASALLILRNKEKILTEVMKGKF